MELECQSPSALKLGRQVTVAGLQRSLLRQSDPITRGERPGGRPSLIFRVDGDVIVNDGMDRTALLAAHNPCLAMQAAPRVPASRQLLGT